MSYPNDAPAAAWYPDPQTPGQVRWWDGTNWTEHVSKPAAPQTAQVDEVAPATAQSAPAAHAPQTIAEQLAAAPAIAVPEVAEADAAFAAADAGLATVTYIGRHAAGAQPAPRQASTAPRFRPRQRVEVPVEAHVESYQYA